VLEIENGLDVSSSEKATFQPPLPSRDSRVVHLYVQHNKKTFSHNNADIIFLCLINLHHVFDDLGACEVLGKSWVLFALKIQIVSHEVWLRMHTSKVFDVPETEFYIKSRGMLVMSDIISLAEISSDNDHHKSQ